MHWYLYWYVYWCVLYCADVHWCVLIYWCVLMFTDVHWCVLTDVYWCVLLSALTCIMCIEVYTTQQQHNTDKHKNAKGAHSGTVRNLHKCIQPCIIAAGVWSVAFVFDTPCWCFTESIKNKKECKISTQKKNFKGECAGKPNLFLYLWPCMLSNLKKNPRR